MYDDEQVAFEVWVERDIKEGWNLKKVAPNTKVTVYCPYKHEKKEISSEHLHHTFCNVCDEQMLDRIDWLIKTTDSGIAKKLHGEA